MKSMVMDKFRQSKRTTWIRMANWTTMSFSNHTRRNELKEICGGVFEQFLNFTTFKSCLVFLELFLFEVIALVASVSKL